MACYCGHSKEEHGHDPEHPGSMACTECDCVAYEEDKDSEEPPTVTMKSAMSNRNAPIVKKLKRLRKNMTVLIFEEEEIDPETFEFKLNGKVIARATHDEHGWAGIDAIRHVIASIKTVLEEQAT